ncbi:NACHT domain-containing NTPase [Nostoc sp. TCL26-01]|uniref:NACHT domain-containing protein n=1 Tax=Nostoc sp. TCL26-01 TaxID=2576904 RepID=UPI0021183EDB|nr:NB-ARC domain-containing protein [Nostoc sp. TCL26-01]
MTNPEIIVIRGAWNGQNYEQMAETSPYSLNYLQRRVATRLFELLNEIFEEQLCKRNLRSFLEAYLGQDKVLTIPGGQLPDIHNFYGRTKELNLLKNLITQQHCIALVGVAGIGKSTLAARLLTDASKEFKSKFDCLLWKSVAHTPRIEELVTELLEILEPQFNQPSSTQAAITLLLKHLQKKRCLLVLDEFEIFHQNVESKFLDYQFFIRRLVEENHKSCLILTSRFLLEEFDDVINKQFFQVIRVEGLDTTAAMDFLHSKGVSNPEKCRQLIKTYRGNPSEMEAALNRVSHFFGNQDNFFENPTTLISFRFETMLNQIFGGTLSNVEKQFLIYLAENLVPGEYVNFTDLLKDFNSRKVVSTLELIKNLEKLERLSLIESHKNPITKEISFTLQPVVKKYIMTDPLGLVHSSDSSSPTVINYKGQNAIAS